MFLLFCVMRSGWKWENFIAEVDAGKGRKFPAKLKPYFRFGLPLLMLVFYVFGLIEYL